MGLHYIVGVSRRWVWVVALLLFLAASLPVQSAINCTPAPEGLAAWWPAEDHAYDIIGKRFGVLNGDAAYAAGQVGRAFSFGGTGGRVRVLESTGNDLSRLPRWTIEAWVRPASFVNATYPMIYSEGNRIVTLGINNGTGKLESWVNNDSSRRLMSTNALVLNSWNHVALVYESGRRLLYLNGILDGGTNTPAITDDSSGASIGQSGANDATTVFQGAVDELSLYNVGLTAAQIAAIHAAGTAGKCFNESPAPTFVLQPASQNGFLGGTVTFAALAAGCPDISYQWLFNGNPLAAAAGYSLTLSNLTFANAGSYSLRATSSFGSATSAVAQIIVPWCTEPSTNIVAWWPADGSGVDAVDHHDGAVWGGTTFGPGVAGSAFCFNGTNDYVAVPDAPELSPHVGTNGEMTVEAWVKLDQLPQTDTVTGQGKRTVLAKGSPGQWEYGVAITTAGVPEFLVWNPGAGAFFANVTGGQILTGQWHHIVATLKKGDAVKLYQDGQLVGTSTNFTGDTADGNSPLYIGRRGDAQFLKGWVDEAALYSRALTSDEVLALYAADGSGKCANAPSPAPYFVLQPENQTGYLLLGAGLTSFAIGTPRPEYQWYKSNETGWVEVLGQTNGALVLTDLSTNSKGNYRAVATSTRGSVTSDSAYLKVIPHKILTSGESFEMGWNGWTTDGSVWQVGVPTSGPGQAHSGGQVAATILDGNYPYQANGRLVSPPLDLPPASAGEEVVLRFWQWFNYYSGYWNDGYNGGWGGNDYGQVQVQVFDTNTLQWSAWSGLLTVARYSAGWSPAQVDLSAYAGRRIRIGFYHTDISEDSDPYRGLQHYETSGWYLDDLSITVRPVETLTGIEGFENGWHGWHAENGVWAVGTNGGHSGSGYIATVPGGNYPWLTASRLISPQIEVPSASAGEEVVLRFWQWFNYYSGYWNDGYNSGDGGNDRGYVQVQVFNTETLQWSEWNTVLTNSRIVQPWFPASIPIAGYSGQRIRVAFYHTDASEDSDPYRGLQHYQSSGWYIDNIFIKRGNLAIASIADQMVNEHETLTFPVTVFGTTPDSCISYQLIDPPTGATIDPTTGVLSWTPKECQGPGVYNIGIYVVDFCNNEANDLGFVKVTVNEVNEPPWLLPAEGTAYVGQTNLITLCSGDPDCPRNPLSYSLLAPVPAGLTIDANTGLVRWAPTLAQLGAYNLRVRLCDGGSPNYCVTNSLTIGVTTNAYALEIQHASADDVRFTLHGGSIAVDYILQQATELCGCECRTAWEDVGRVSPTEMPYAFDRAMDRRYKFFRLRETPRSP